MTLITVKVKPGSKESSISEGADGVITVRVKSRPIKGAANQELIKLLAYYFKTPPSTISIKSGLSGRTKIIQLP